MAGLNLVNAQDKMSYFGEKISQDGAMPVQDLADKLSGADTIHAKISGTVSSVCQKKGCWIKMDLKNGESMMVRFTDYAFFLPKDCAGKKVILDGMGFVTKTSVEELRHYAEDAGKSKEEISAIVKPEHQMSFEASGVILYNE
ncbi:MAG: DUF4920 domain-containing protein [Bacteroidetes bacterium]|nr:MAG: DUF4920 domain-containing protein [Bacteroidota bacterium]REK04709.1 MAG: DUF4920 domain-containing protein [Bacteroidota bacterium]REK36183.1 MAG: DUF4920 domain-containing protein [Bacteroidota bacterium]REK51446.1 MAG: DUF4920 domain-containing protein [Bacteroidota bacterium]